MFVCPEWDRYKHQRSAGTAGYTGKNTDTPENSAGMLFPTVSRFSSVDPAQGQNGMLVFWITQVRQVLRDTISGMIPKTMAIYIPD